MSNLYVYFNIETVSTCSIRCNLSWHVRTANIQISLHVYSLISLNFPPEEKMGLWLSIECLSKTQCITRRHMSVRWAHMPTCNFSCADEQSDLSLRWAHRPICNFWYADAHSDLSLRWAHMPTCNFSYADAQSDLSLRWAHKPTCNFCCAMRSLIWVFDRRICRLVTLAVLMRSLIRVFDGRISRLVTFAAQCAVWSECSMGVYADL